MSKLLQIARDALLDLRHASVHLGAREVPIAVVHRLELAAVDRDAGFRKQAHRAAQRDEACAHFADGSTIVPTEIGNGLVIGNEPTRQPHDLNVASGLTLEPAARLNPVEIAVDVELQQDRRMIRRPAGYLGIDPAEPKLGKIEFVGKDVDHPNGIVLADPVFQAFRKQRALPAIRAFNEAPHPTLPRIISRESHQKRRFHTGSVIFDRDEVSSRSRHVRCALKAEVKSGYGLCRDGPLRVDGSNRHVTSPSSGLHQSDCGCALMSSTPYKVKFGLTR